MPSLPCRKLALTLLVALAGAPSEAGVNLRAAFAQLDPDVAASADFAGATLSAGIESDTGFGVGLEYEWRRVALGLSLFQTEHDIAYDASFLGIPLLVGEAAQVELLTALVSLRFRLNPDSRVVFSLGPVVGGLGYTDFELPDGDTEDGGTAVFGGEIAVDADLGDGGWFLRGAYRILDADLDIDEDLGIDPVLDEELRGFLDTSLDPTLASVEIGYRF